MNKILIKKVSRPGVDSEMFRAYKDDGAEPSARTTLKVSASTTGGTEIGAIRCAAKAFKRYVEPGGDLNEIETRIKLTPDQHIDDLWVAELSPKSPCDHTHPMANHSWISAAMGLPDSEQSVLVHAPDADEPVWLGFHDGECWRWASAERIETEVTHWMTIPEPPEP